MSQHTLEAFTFPLHGNRLIEASAGTGKTYTIANLYLRSILGHGDDNSKHCQPLTVDQILVVTFTEAATAELRDRIRKKIHQARMAFIKKKTSDPFIQQLLDQLEQPEEKILLLEAAERQMDEAAIFTIHGFCQRMLKQHAFESGTLFTSELVSDIEPLLQTSVADYWRKKLYPLDKPTAQMVRLLWKAPTDLLRDIRSWLGLSSLTLDAPKVPGSLDQLHEKCLRPWLELKKLWRASHDEIAENLKASGLRDNSPPINRIPIMKDFIDSDDLTPTLKKNESWNIYGSVYMSEKLKKNGELPDHPIFAKIEGVLNSTQPPEAALKAIVLKETLASVKRQFNALKASKHQLSFDDLLANLASALRKDRDDMLANAIREQYRIAMIDEFQDTDPLQYEIFNRIYVEPEDREAGLFMIGDPKQAIYAFRGADIFTYIDARKQVNAHYNLGTNWRSTSPMIDSVNAVFQSGNSPFIYDDDIPFNPVAASPKADKEQLLENQQSLPAMNIWLQENDGETLGSGEYLKSMTDATVAEIKRILTASDNGHAIIKNKDSERPVQPKDISVLVRTSSQGQQVREALAKYGIASIYLSNNDSVYNGQEANDIFRLLNACLNPGDERLLKAALATPLLHLKAIDLDALNTDEQAWELAVDEFRNYQMIWQNRGVLPMLRTLISHRGIAEKLLAGEFGERRLTNLLHLGELLSTASLGMDSAHALVRWFGEQIESPDSKADEQQLHLESERNLVKIVTIHKSKGLEYNIVFLPFICHYSKRDNYLYHDKSGEAIIDLLEADDSKKKADRERLAEDLRLLYVALTRSVHRCYLGFAPFKSGNAKTTKTDLHLTAMGYLLNNGEVIEAAELEAKVSDLGQQSSAISIQALPKLDDEVYIPPKTAPPELKAREFSGIIPANWWVTSYSALSKNSHSSSRVTSTEPDASLESAGHDIEVQNEKNELPVNDYNLFQFPKGARPGTFMHTLFETLDMETAKVGNLSEFVTHQLQKEGYEEHWAPALEQMLNHCLNAPLDGKELRLLNIPESSRCVEMEFYLPVKQLAKSALNQLIQQHDPLSQLAGELDFAQVQGMLKGFIDLTFEYQGRWYVLDYKSNWLGEQVSDYSQENMKAMMIDHRYDLQYQLYSLALHRLLKQRLPDYDYEQHFGGAIYLFLRGVRDNDPQRHGIFEHRPSKQLIEQLDRLFAGALSSKKEEYQP